MLSGCFRNVDINPQVNPERLVGEYSNSTDILLIKEDRTYIKQMLNGYENGYWSLSDSNMKLTSDKKKVTYIKIYEEDGLYQLIIKDRKRKDPDSYDFSKMMERVVN